MLFCNTGGLGGHSGEMALERSLHRHEAGGDVRDAVIGTDLAHDGAEPLEQAGLEGGKEVMFDVVVEIPVVKFDELQHPVPWLPVA